MQYYIVSTERSSAQEGTFITSITRTGSLPQDRDKADLLLIDSAEEDGCGELDWKPCDGSFACGGITADVEILELKMTLAYSLCSEEDLISLDITFERLERCFRAACEHAGLTADFAPGEAFSYKDTQTGTGRTFRQLRNTNPVTYADIIRDLVKADLAAAEETDAEYTARQSRFLGRFTRTSDEMRLLEK